LGRIAQARSSSKRTRRARERTGQRGVTLVEIMVATLILGIVAIGMVEFFASGRIGFDREEHKRVATLLAQEALERTIAQPYNQINPWSEQRTVGVVDYVISVTTQSDVPESNMKTVLSTVNWNATPTVTRSTSMVTLVFEN